jgi:hypothetical protein
VESDCHVTNTLAYLASSSAMKEKSFKTLTPTHTFFNNDHQQEARMTLAVYKAELSTLNI